MIQTPRSVPRPKDSKSASKYPSTSVFRSGFGLPIVQRAVYRRSACQTRPCAQRLWHSLTNTPAARLVGSRGVWEIGVASPSATGAGAISAQRRLMRSQKPVQVAAPISIHATEAKIRDTYELSAQKCGPDPPVPELGHVIADVSIQGHQSAPARVISADLSRFDARGCPFFVIVAPVHCIAGAFLDGHSSSPVSCFRPATTAFDHCPSTGTRRRGARAKRRPPLMFSNGRVVFSPSAKNTAAAFLGDIEKRADRASCAFTRAQFQHLADKYQCYVSPPPLRNMWPDA